ncbi:helicase [Pseudoflavonifractor phocaeensis]|uniref:helicase-related protein n=1 Tax=Pseudoflavonifractor phocaeensis TaxID=1870988 RepID=UPI00195DE476|nr:helicase-related protein [Pseudoflavonifractor phocaeensis]MBM6937838.1 helicase [Pseudoflavonifractor phocaeensis]
MSHTDLKFFTNEPERDLYSRFAAILKSNTQFFDILVGYFRASGFFKMYEALESVEKIRILIGLNVDKFTVKIIDRVTNEVNVSSLSAADGKEIIADEIEKEFETAVSSAVVEKGVRVFMDWLKSGKLEMRMYTQAPIHAKVYIMRKDQEKVPDTFGSVITGSSNFSEAGLINNLEFNVELKDYADVKFALDKFEELWNQGVDIKETYIEAVEQNTWMRSDITPYQLYLKTLYEFFKEEINADKENFETLLPDGYMRLQYQIDAVTQARQKLDAYNGVFISDVVGLGKTYICAMLANSFNRNTYKLFICPPVLVDYWRSVLQEFDVSRCDVESLGKLDKIIAKGADKYSYVFVDEAHRFRNSGTEAFTDLHQICRGKKVILISATPINNYTSDIENQLYLFQAKQSGTINGIKNIEGFFRGLNSKLAKLPKGSNAYMAQLRENSEVIRDRLIREVMIRRTRSEIQEYYADDLAKQGLVFPKAGSPEKIVYEFDEETDDAFNQTISIIKDFKYARYTPLLYLKDKKKYAQMLTAQRNMGGFMKGILVKRLESSFYAFSKTLDRFAESYTKFIAMAKSGKVYISKKVNVYDLLDSGDTQKLMYLLEQQDVMEFETKEFSSQFIRDLEADLAQLKSLQFIWSLIKDDPKLEEFKHNITTNPLMKGKKVIVFTESMETAEYLFAQLSSIYGDRIIYYSGQSSPALKVEIEDSFNPKFKSKNNDKYDLLITTDVLAEGINLHRANVLVNYDLPWNPTRIMQRVGRINRVGTEHDRIYVFNFFPTAQSKKQMPLEERILEKLQSFHDTLGEDFKYLSDEEEVSSKKLFSDLTSDLDGEEQSTNPELAYLGIIRQIRDNDPKLFATIKRLPKKAKAGKMSCKVEDSSTVTFIRKGALKTFFLSSGDKAQQLTFMQAIELIHAEPDDKKVSVSSEYYNHFSQNNIAFDEMLVAEEEVTTEKVMVTGNDAKIIRLLKAIKREPRLTDDQEETIDKMIKFWENGEIPAKVSKDIIKKSTIVTDIVELYYEILKLIPPTYFEEKKSGHEQVDGEKQIILSCYLEKGGKSK